MERVNAITAFTTVGYCGLLSGTALIGAVSYAVSLECAFLGIVCLLTASLFAVRRHEKVFA